MRSSEIRESFLTFFERHGHRIVSSSPLVPHDDPTLLFTNAGMNQFKDVFLGRERRDYTRAATSQKCMRVSGKHNDLDNVGPSLAHHTFFEMLGNFSFGDYFKEGAIALAWELLTSDWKLPPDRLHATIFAGEAGIPRDGEAYAAWQRFLPSDRIAELGLAENFWSMGDTGPSGRCSEIHYFRGDDLPCPEPVCKGVACGCDRFIEIWNNVFMEFDRGADGSLAPLPAPSIDTGMGLERIAATLQNKPSNYDTDLFTPLLGAIGEATGAAYEPPHDVSMRVVADHSRAACFLLADGVVPSNEWRGYVLRKIMRRAMRHGKRLGMNEPFLHRLVDVVVAEMGSAYPELRAGRDAIVQVVRSEEERFDAVLTGGLPRLEEALNEAAASRRLSGEAAFRLYDTYGIPLDFIEDLAGERRVGVDRDGFERAMQAQREKARARSAFDTKRADEFIFTADAARQGLAAAGDAFEGHARTTVKGVAVLAVFDADRRQVTALGQGQVGYLALEKTPFYLEAGGQVSDSGQIYAESGSGAARVEGVGRIATGLPRVHRVRVTSGTLAERDLVTAEVDEEIRDATRRNHTATHLLHAALRQVLGTHVKQAGSLVAPDRLRFDFVHFAPLTRDQLDEIERIVNEEIYRNTVVQTEVRATQEAIAAGAMALFGEKYGERVRVVSIPGFSTELCGGTHCRATGDIGLFTIVQETGIAAGVRRIEALTGAAAITRDQERRALLDRLLAALAAPESQAVEAVEQLQAEAKRLAREVSQLKMHAALGTTSTGARATDDVADVGGVKMIARAVSGLDKTALGALTDSLRDRLTSGVIVLAGESEGKVVIVAAVSPDLVGRLHAGQILKQIAPIVSGGGGGRPDFAEAGGKNPARIPELIAESQRVVRRMLEASARSTP